ncbi:MAG TPA: alkaline phosphatase family protein [Acidothermaceae bacterium]
MDSIGWIARTSALTAVLALTGSVGVGIGAGSASAASVPRPAHVVVVLMENHAYGQIIGSTSAPYLNSLAYAGASFTNAHGVTHPSQPNYLALFSGSTQGVTSDSCPHTFPAGNLASELVAAKLGFKAYSESLPAAGSMVCTSGSYARKHAPWTNFTDVPASRQSRQLSHELHQPADRVVCRPESPTRHARRNNRAGGHLAESAPRFLCHMGEDTQQLARCDLG